MLRTLLKHLSRGSLDPTFDWPAVTPPAAVIHLQARSIGGLRFGDPIDEARRFGRADHFIPHEGKACSLVYAKPGLLLQFDEKRRLSYCSFPLAADPYFPKCPGLVYATPVFSDGLRLTSATTEAEICALFGKPKSEDRDEEEIILNIERDGLTLEFELTPAGHLKMLNLFPTVEMK